MVDKITNIKERILQIAEYEGIAKEIFFKKINMSYGNFKGKSKKTPINSNAIADIFAIFPELNLEWLLTGKGEMLKNKTNPIQKHTLYTDITIDDIQRIPLYNMEATASFVEILDQAPELKADQYLSIPNLPKCDGAIHVTGDSMYPLIKSGDIAVYKEIKDIVNNIFWGEMYLISLEVDDEYYTTIKYIQKSEEGPEYVKLVSQNRHHGDKNVLLAKIKALALVKATVRFNAMG